MNAVCVRRDSFVRTAAFVAAVGCLAAPTTGCKSGSWGTKPAWMTFGQKAEDVDGLASSAAGAGDVPKPSAIAKPYPTTATPQGYSLADATAQGATLPGSAPAAVTYGASPPPAAATTPSSVAQAAPASVSPSASIAPQVGPYAPSAAAAPGASPAPPSSSWTSPALVAVPPAAAEAAPATVSTAPPPWASSPVAAAAAPEASPPERFADARAASPAWTPAPLEPPPADGRYGTSGTSRFSTGTLPAAASFAPPATPAELAPAVEPASATPVPAMPAAPLRRPDPGYRPGGTSSYRPARSSLAGGEPPAGVQPTSFQPQAVAP